MPRLPSWTDSTRDVGRRSERERERRLLPRGTGKGEGQEQPVNSGFPTPPPPSTSPCSIENEVSGSGFTVGRIDKEGGFAGRGRPSFDAVESYNGRSQNRSLSPVRNVQVRDPTGTLRSSHSLRGQGSDGGVGPSPPLVLPPSYRLSGTRFVMLANTALMLLGSYYNFDLPSAIRGEILDTMGVTDNQYGILAGIYSYPNTVMPLLGGLLIDSVGVPRSVLLFTSVIAVGQILFAQGIPFHSFSLLILGRLLFGFGGECLNVATSTLMTQWFKGRELTFALGTSLTVSRLGSVIVFNSQPWILRNYGLLAGCEVGAAFALLSVVCSVVCMWIERKADAWDRSQGLPVKADEPAEDVSMRDVASFGRHMWAVVFSCVFTYIGIFPFYQLVSAAFLRSKGEFGFDLQDANFITSLPTLVSAFSGPFISIVVDRVGLRPQLLTLSSFCLTVCFAVLLLLPPTPQGWWVVWIYLGIGLSVAVYGSVIWACIPFVVDANKVGTAYGLTFAVQNIGQALAPLLISELMQEVGRDGDFTKPVFILLLGALLGSLSAAVLWYMETIPATRCGLVFSHSEELTNRLMTSPTIPPPSEGPPPSLQVGVIGIGGLSRPPRASEQRGGVRRALSGVRDEPQGQQAVQENVYVQAGGAQVERVWRF